MAKTGGIGGKLVKALESDKALPSELGECIKLLAKARAARKAMEAKVSPLKAEEDRIKDHIILTFKKEDLRGAKSRHGAINLSEKDVPEVDPETGGWTALYEYIKKHDAFDLLHKRIGEAAAQARWEVGEEIPGVKKFHKIDVSLSEVK